MCFAEKRYGLVDRIALQETGAGRARHTVRAGNRLANARRARSDALPPQRMFHPLRRAIKQKKRRGQKSAPFGSWFSWCVANYFFAFLPGVGTVAMVCKMRPAIL